MTFIGSRVCALCGVTFTPRPSKAVWRVKYCSAQCCRKASKNAADKRSETRTRKCANCGNEFSYLISRGTDRRFCSDPECHRDYLRRLAGGKPMCVTPGCQNKRGYNSGLCNSCYVRIRRSGTVEKRQWAYRSKHSNGYIVIWEESHPLAVKGRVFEHRRTLFAAIGDGTHACHWCGVSVQWMKSGTAKRGTLVVDHLDGDKANNERSNLVPSCSKCNWLRGILMSWVAKHQDDPILWRMVLNSQGHYTVREQHAQSA